MDVTIDQTHFTIIDVGGQTSERKKWRHSLNNLSAIVFVVAISYDILQISNCLKKIF